ncbi:MAG: S8 family serine peptidase [Terriglobia bacterium]
MGPVDVVNLAPLMNRTAGRPEIIIGLIDGPVLLHHPDLENQHIRVASEKAGSACSRADSFACTHGTFIAGILRARRGSSAPAICPGCTLLVRPIFAETTGDVPSAAPEELAAAVVESVDGGARVLNLSVALARPSPQGERRLTQALDYAAGRRVITVAAAGNQGTVGGSAITRHPGVIPVAACDLLGRPLSDSNLGSSIGRRGLSAPGQGIMSLGTGGKSQSFGGTSAATPFVTGAVALLWSEFPGASAAEVRLAVTRCGGLQRNALAPPVLDAWAAYQAMKRFSRRR